MPQVPEPDRIFLPLAQMIPLQLRSKTLLKSPGVFYPARATDPISLAFNWGDEPRLMMLEGQFPFRYFRQQLGHSIDGFIVENVEFWADPSSRYDSSKKDDPLGALMLSGGQLFVIGLEAGNQFADPQAAPTGVIYGHASDDVKIGFKRWSIVTWDHDSRAIIWSTSDKSENTTVS